MCSRNIRKLCDNLTIIYLTTQVQEQNQLIRIELYIREHWPFLSIKLIKIELLVSVGRSINAALINQEIRGRLNFVQREERVQRVVFQTDIHAFLDSNRAYSRYFSPVDRNQLPRLRSPSSNSRNSGFNRYVKIFRTIESTKRNYRRFKYCLTAEFGFKAIRN